MKKKVITVYWHETVFMKNTIEVPLHWTAEDIMNDPDGLIFDGAKDCGSEIDWDSIEIIRQSVS